MKQLASHRRVVATAGLPISPVSPPTFAATALPVFDPVPVSIANVFPALPLFQTQHPQIPSYQISDHDPHRVPSPDDARFHTPDKVPPPPASNAIAMPDYP